MLKSSSDSLLYLAAQKGKYETAKLFIPKPLSDEQKILKLIDAIQILVATQNEVKHLQQEIKSKQKRLDKAITKELKKKRGAVKEEYEKASINRQKAYNELEEDKTRLFLTEKKAKELHAVVFQKIPMEVQKNISEVVEPSSLDKDKALLVAKEVVCLREKAIANRELWLSIVTTHSWQAMQRLRKAKSNEQMALNKQQEAQNTYYKNLSELRCAPSHRHAESLLELLQADKEKTTAVFYEMRSKRALAEKISLEAANARDREHKKLESYKEKLNLAMRVEEKLAEAVVKPKSRWNIKGKRLADSGGITLFSKRLNPFEVASDAIETPCAPSTSGLMETTLGSHLEGGF